ncbi:endopeptidase La [bacterium endosymbiont of Pedicinus badii]|uniref:endopeptidase La n=1 Tax=bacterium endosymbiont of Pedicinus badii TaxID=1719126 RepID=UPI0009B97CA9|nr:endopeptidase La [bacterium endosymbiont of Pedicinus badii]OQM34294.1 DNA-binding protein [bacterium endosymbiont of Pedicinus badii]
MNNTECFESTNIPVLPLRDVVIYPYMIIPLFIGREKSIRCLKTSMKDKKKIMLVAQKEPSKDNPNPEDLYSIGTISNVLQMLKLPDGTVKVLVEGKKRAKILKIIDNGKHFVAEICYLQNCKIPEKENKIFIRTIINQFEVYIKLNKKIPREVLVTLNNIKNTSRLADTIAAHIPLRLKEKQKILEEIDLKKRIENLMKFMESEIEILKIEKKIRNRIRKQMEKSQREYYLNEQMKAIQKELGENEINKEEYQEIRNKMYSSQTPSIVRKKLVCELNKLKMMPSISAEATVVRSYIETVLSIPWKKKTKIKKNILEAKKILDQEHYGLYEIKERILEHLAVQNRKNKIQGPILCLVGPPGVGKTSLGKSIAKATGRKYIRISLGGLRDEAEIRGHRRTYIGSMPGKIIQKISKIGVKNPLFVLDEIDKISSDIRGDPSSALLEVLDIEQNFAFNDHYLELDYDLSEVMFIATANTLEIPYPLLDRMEIINLSGYTEEEKINIASMHLIPKQMQKNGIRKKEVKISKKILKQIIINYTKESGIRGLEREISKIYRKSIKIFLTRRNTKKITITKKNLKRFLGEKKFEYEKVKETSRIGKVIGLAWTELGGELLYIESIITKGKGNLICTGSIGKVMQESVKAGLTFLKYESKNFGISSKFYSNHDIHIHFPEGAVPKDGPSAGISICTAIFSSIVNNPVNLQFSMTGEITIFGNILPVGGIKEKILASQRGNIYSIIIPKKNKKEISKIPKKILQNTKIHFVTHIKEVFKIILLNKLTF